MPLVSTGAVSFYIESIDAILDASITGSFTYEKKSSGVPGGTQSFWSNTNDAVDGLLNVVEDITPELGGDLEVLDNDIIIAEPTTDHTSSSINVIEDTIKTGEGGLFGLVYQGSDGEWTTADKDSYATRCTRMSLNASAGVQKIMKSGLARDDSWAWTIGGTMYLGDAGQMTQDVSGFTTDDVQQIVGEAVTATIVDFNPEKGGIEVL